MFKRNEFLAPVCFVAFLFGLMFTGTNPANASEGKAYRPYLVFNIATRHLGTDQEYNELNTGVGYGIAFPVANGGEVSPEVGFYKNSFSTKSMYAAVTYDVPVADLGRQTELRLGGFAGLVTYPENTQKFRDSGAIMVGESVLLAGLSATLRHKDRYDLRARVLPGGSAASAIVTLQLGIRY